MDDLEWYTTYYSSWRNDALESIIEQCKEDLNVISTKKLAAELIIERRRKNENITSQTSKTK